MKIDLDYIVNLSDEELMKLNRQQVIRRLKVASNIAIDRRNEALDYLRQHPETPKPLIYKDYSAKTYDNKKPMVVWKDYEFDWERGESLNKLRHKLIITRKFLQSKTSSIEGWLQSLKEFSIKLGKSIDAEIKIDELSGIKYNRLWEVYNRLKGEPSTGTQYDTSEKLIKLIYQTMTSNMNPNKIYNRSTDTRLMGIDRLTYYLENLLESNYEQQQVSDFDITDEELSNIFKGMGRQG